MSDDPGSLGRQLEAYLFRADVEQEGRLAIHLALQLS